MIRITSLITLLIFSYSSNLLAQNGKISGEVKIDNDIVQFATVRLTNTTFGATTNIKGQYTIQDIPWGQYTVEASYLGYKPISQQITLSEGNPAITVSFKLEEETLMLDDIVVTGTKTFQRKTNSPVIVNVLNSQSLENIQACSLSDGLKFQPGLRVETDCQTCNYTQLRMNGLTGGYSQILINGRPIFSPLTGLYGMEQLPVNMIDRIEVIRGGGSSLYGSSAIGGTVNVITKIPKANSHEIGYTYERINGHTDDHQFTGNTTLVAPSKNSGVSFFINKRNRSFYDHNDDNFSEMPKINNTSLGSNLFFLPTDHQKVELSVSHLNEYRFGGEMVDKPAHLAQQSEERTHYVWMGSADYQINFNDDRSSFISYLAGQRTTRKHYTGIIPDDPIALTEHYKNPPYGTSDVSTFNGGIQINHALDHGSLGENVFTFGGEYILDDVFDEIPTYEYKIDQVTKNLGLFLQSDWKITPIITFLSGLRMDKHNFVDNLTFSPRASLLFKVLGSQFRLNYGAGFRAPQAFDTDLHIAFAGGGISRVALSPELKPEHSQSVSASFNYDKISEHYVAGFTLEAFHTKLQDAFYLTPIGQDRFGEIFEKRNGQGAVVQGTTLELRANYDRKCQLEAGLTLQTSKHERKIVHIDGVPGIRDFIRTPKAYGFATLSFTPNKQFSANINYVYTGSMLVPHFAGAPNQEIDEIITSKSFSNISAKIGYLLPIKHIDNGLEIFGGVRNILNDYQRNFDIGKNRDSNFIYGPSQPRTFYMGIKLTSL